MPITVRIAHMARTASKVPSSRDEHNEPGHWGSRGLVTGERRKHYDGCREEHKER
jgi:hypothetical protein